MKAHMDNHQQGLAWLFAVGIAAGLGLALQGERLPLRVYIGRSLVGGVTAGVAAAFLTVFPDLPLAALVGIGCFCGVVGAESLMKMVGDYLSRKKGG